MKSIRPGCGETPCRAWTMDIQYHVWVCTPCGEGTGEQSLHYYCLGRFSINPSNCYITRNQCRMSYMSNDECQKVQKTSVLQGSRNPRSKVWMRRMKLYRRKSRKMNSVKREDLVLTSPYDYHLPGWGAPSTRDHWLPSDPLPEWSSRVCRGYSLISFHPPYD